VESGLWEAAARAAPVAIYLFDEEGRIRLWNDAAARLFGWTEEEVLGSPDPTLPPKARAAFESLARSAGAAGAMLAGTRLVKSGGKIRVESVLAPVPRGSDPLRGWVVTARPAARRLRGDHAARLEAERAARIEAEGAERRARFLADASWLLDGTIACPAALEELARLAVPSIADRCWIHTFQRGTLSLVAEAAAASGAAGAEAAAEASDDGGEFEHRALTRAVRTGRPILVQHGGEAGPTDGLDSRGADAPGRLRSASVCAVPLMKGESVAGAITLALTSSGRRYSEADFELAEQLAARVARAVETARLYEESRRAVADRERLLAVVSHDLRNSLATVLLNASAILESPDEHLVDSPVGDQLQWIARSAEQMSRLISDLLDVSAIEQGRFSLDVSPQRVDRIIRDAVEMFGPLAAEKQIGFSWGGSEILPDVLADPQRLHQVLGNLIGNAIKFSPDGASLLLRADLANAEEVCFSVADAGPGIAPENLPDVFELYWQHDRERRGAGLGLAIAKAIVEAHGGRIWAETRANGGSTFRFTIPIARRQPPAS
jgi:PAS domain S-box-containing protein